MPNTSSLAVCASRALNAKPDSPEHRERLAVLESVYHDNPDDIVLGLICDVLKGRSVHGDVNYIGEHAASFSSFFNNSPAIANMREEVCAWVECMLRQHHGDCLNLADLGCGDGQAIGKVIARCANKDTHRQVKLFLNDTQTGMLDTAEQHVRSVSEDVGVPITVHTCHGFAQEPVVTEEMRNFFGSDMTSVIITATASIHHMPYNQKIILLKQLATLQPRLMVIGDANSEHDVHNLPKSPEIIACTVRLYGSLYRSLKYNGATEEVLKAARFFLGSEARNIIMNDMDKRIDYHTTVEHWKEVLSKSGFVIVNPKDTTPYLTDNPTRRVNTTHFETYVFEEEVLCFTIGTKVARHT